MKLAKLSLAAMVVAGLASSSFAADTLADSFKNGKVSGELKAWYFDQSADGQDNLTGSGSNINSATRAGHRNNANIFTTAAVLGYVTDSFYGFNIGLTFQGAANPGTVEQYKAGTSQYSAASVFKNDENAGGGVLSEAYLAYTLGKTTAKVGRQFMSTPLVNGSGSRIFTESFEGALLVNTDLPQTTLIAAYVDRFQGRTSSVSNFPNVAAASAFPSFTPNAYSIDGNGDAPTFEKSAAFTGGAAGGLVAKFDGAYSAGVINKSINNVTLTGQYAVVKDVEVPLAALASLGLSGKAIDDIDVYYTEVNYVLPLSGFKLGFDANFRGSKAGSQLDVANLDGTYTAGRLSISELAGFGASFAYGKTSKDDAVIAGMGNGPTSYTSTMIRGTSTRMLSDTDSYLFQATYDFGKLGVTGLTAVAQYGWTKQGDDAGNLPTGAITGTSGRASVASADYTNTAIGLTYAIPAVKGLTTSLQYEMQERELNADPTIGGTTYTGYKGAKTNTDELWFKAGYKF